MNKTITFLDTKYIVPVWVNWVGRNADGTIVGYQWAPFKAWDEGMLVGYDMHYGQECVIYSPRCEPVLRRV
jgi:hypothetical protein